MEAILSLGGMRRLPTNFKWGKKWKECDRRCEEVKDEENGEINGGGEPHTSGVHVDEYEMTDTART